jgi:hypothetical protein
MGRPAGASGHRDDHNAWRAFANRDWDAVERDTRQARVVAWRKAGRQGHHAIYLELAETLIARRPGGPWPARDPTDQRDDERSHQAVQQALLRLTSR